MRLLFFVQRYGPDVAGGAEAAARDVAVRMAARGHDVEVVTTCARSYMTWANEFDPGTSEIDGVIVHRLPVRRPRDARFDDVNQRIMHLGNGAPDSLQRLWQHLQGPDVTGVGPLVDRLGTGVDAAVFFTYLYATTHRGMAAARSQGIPTALVPCAHEEPTLRLRINRRVFVDADRFLYLTLEEAVLITQTFRPTGPSFTVGLGTDVGLDDVPDGDDIRRVRDTHGIADRYLTYVGRIDPNKGVDWLARLHAQWAQLPGSTADPLVLVGDPVVELPASRAVQTTGFVSDADRQALIAGAVALVHPSPYESFALTLIETWALGRPVMVHRDSPVLAGQVARSGGGLAFDDLSTYDVAVDALMNEAGLADQLAMNGRSFVDDHYRWDVVLDRWEQALSA